MGFSRQEYWSELPFPTPGDLPDPGIEPMSLALQADSLLLSHWGLLSVNQQIILDISPHSWREVNQSRARVGLGGAEGSLLL